MLKQLREQFPALFDRMGPTCYVRGRCSEGRLTCGKQEEMRLRFGQTLEE